jgi:hypothetical protein
MEERGIGRLSPPDPRKILNPCTSSPILLDVTDLQTSPSQSAPYYPEGLPSLGSLGIHSLSENSSSLSTNSHETTIFGPEKTIRDPSLSFLSASLTSVIGKELALYKDKVASMKEDLIALEKSYQTFLDTESNQLDIISLTSRLHAYELRTTHIDEELMKFLIRLDSYTFKDQESNERYLRKQLIVYLQSMHDQLDQVLKSIRTSMNLYKIIPKAQYRT